MNNNIVIAIDAMGSDRGPKAIIAGASISKDRNPNVSFIFFGNEIEIKGLLSKRKNLSNSSEVIHTSEFISSDEKPSLALRRRKVTSMGMAIDCVAQGKADAIVSAGNTGALMAISKLQLRTLKGISRPAIAATLPHKHGEFVMLDLGANLECNAQNLVEFSIMGYEFAKVVLGQNMPRVALLNVGTENEKGKANIQEAAEILKKSSISKSFVGFVEGNALTLGVADVIVTDGFSGNIALKTAEGIAKLCGEYLKALFKGSILGKIGYLLMRSSFLTLKDKLDPRKRNGAMFLGLNGIVVKSHGGADSLSFASALDITVDMVKGGAAKKIIDNLNTFSIDR